MSSESMWNLFDKATASVGAYAILENDGTYVARIVFRYPRDGASRLYCYAQAWGENMVRAYAGGGGYDKRTAAAHEAVRKLKADSPDSVSAAVIADMQAALSSDGGRSWRDQLEAAGFRVLGITD